MTMNKRKLKLDKYGISSKRYKELCGFCEQYPDWKKELLNHSYLSAVQYHDTPGNPNRGTSDATGDTAVRLAIFDRNCTLIERVAREAGEESWEFIIKSVCYEVPLTYLVNVENLCMSKSAFYDRRRYFFFLLDKEKNKIFE